MLRRTVSTDEIPAPDICHARMAPGSKSAVIQLTDCAVVRTEKGAVFSWDRAGPRPVDGLKVGRGVNLEMQKYSFALAFALAVVVCVNRARQLE